MASDWSGFLSRDDLLGGLPARRASTLLYAIESRTGHLVVRSRHAVTNFLDEKSAEEHERSFLDAMGLGRTLPIAPSIQDIERYAGDWASLVPVDPGVRAVVARMIGEKYVVPRSAVPGLRRVLGLDETVVQDAFERLHGRALSSIFATRVPRRERLRWPRMKAARRLESLPPFWTAFALTLTGTVGTSTLALPIAAAEFGPVAGLVVLIVLGLLNVLTIAAMSEAVSRSGGMHYGSSSLGRFVADYFGRSGVAIFTVVSLLACGVSLLVRFIGLADTMATGVGLPAALWLALLLVVNIYFLSRDSVDTSVASTLVVGGVTVGLLLALSMLALPHLNWSNLGYHQTPIVGSGSIDRVGAGLLVGVTLSILARHVAIGSTAKIVLRQDPSGRALLWGSVSAFAVCVALHCLWIVAVNGAVDANALTSQTGTALGPLADVSGPVSRRIGELYAVLALGLGSVYMSLVLFQYVRDLLPADVRLPDTTAPGGANFVKRATTMTPARKRFLIGLSPVLCVFLIAEGLILTDRESFTKPIAFISAITGPLVAGIFPMLLLIASRRRGEYVPATVLRFLGHPLVVAGVYLVSLAGIFTYGLIIWDDPLQRAVGVTTGAVMIVMNVIFVRRGSFRPRALVEVRTDRRTGNRGVFTVTDGGRPVATDVLIAHASGEREIYQATGDVGPFRDLRSAAFALSPVSARELTVWAHEVGLDGESQPIPVRVTVDEGTTVVQQDLNLGQLGGKVLLPLDGKQFRVRLSFVGQDVTRLDTVLGRISEA